jgi:hypothetical protein
MRRTSHLEESIQMPDIVFSLTNPHDVAVAALLDVEIATQLDRQTDFKFSDLPRLMVEALESPNTEFPHESSIIAHALRLLEARRPLEPYLADIVWSFDEDSGNFRMQRCESHALTFDPLEAIC